MGTQNKEIKIALDIQAKIDKASNQINTLKKQIDKFELSKSLAGDFAKEFKNIEHEIAELQRRTASGEINLIDAKAAEKEIDKIEKRWAFLLNKVGGESFLEKGLKADAQAMAALESLAKSYAAGIKEAEQQETKLNKKLEEAKQRQKDLAEAQKQQKVVKEAELADQKAQLAILQKQEKAAKKTRDEAEKALRAKVEESGGKYSMAEVSQKGSKLRKTDAYRTFRDAQAAYDAAQANTKAQQTNVDSMVTKSMQLAEATTAKEAIDKATEALENYRQTTLATAKEDAFKKAKESLKSIAEFKDIDWDNFNIDLSSIKSVEELEEALAGLRIEAENKAKQAIEEISETAKEASTGFESLDKDVKTAKDSLVEMDEQARQTEAFEARIKQFLGMAGAVELLRRALRQAFETTKELDAAMTEMAVVTDLDVGDYWDQLPEHTKRASELGVAIHSVYEAETLYYQQGLKTAEAQELANTTLKMARIAGLDAAEATDKMTAALRGFNMELNDTSAENVADVYSKLAAITAADVNEISSAMTKTASIASAAGMEFETTAAFLSQIIETTRESAETAGTAMKTVIARFSEVKKLQGEGLMTGSDEEGEVIDVNKIQTALRTVGISMDEFFEGTEGLDSIFLKLAEKWDTLDVKTQRYIATTAAGSRQQSRFIAMMSDYARTQELVTAANNSAGASQEQYEKTLESLESKLAKLKNAWDEFSMGILQSDLVKFGVDALTKFLEIINKATSALDGMGGTITKVLTTIALFKLGQKIFEGIKAPMANFFTKLVKDVYEEGIKAGQSFAQGLQDSYKTEEQKQEEAQKAEQEKREEYLDVKPSKGILQKAGNATGISNFGKQKLINEKEEYDFKKLKTMKEEGGKKKYEQDYLNAKKKIEDIDTRKKNGEIIDQKEIDEATQGLIDAEDALVNYKKTEEKVQEASQKGWENIGQGFQKLGTTIAGVGIGISMLGGIMSELGLEEVGEGLSTVGNLLTVVGGGISVIGTLTPVVAKIVQVAGITTQAAWGWVAVIGLALAALAAAIMVSFEAAKKASPEGQLKAAAQSSQDAADAAEEAVQQYENLSTSLEDLGDKYKILEDLTKGTKEWNNAVRDINQSVLELIQDYPELTKFISNTKGYLEIDIDSAEVQDILQQAEDRVVLASAWTSMANVDLAKEKNDSTYSMLNKDAKLKYAKDTSQTGFGGAGALIYNQNRGIDSEKDAKDTTDKIAKEMAEGKTGLSADQLSQHLVEKYGMTADAAAEVAAGMMNNAESLREYGESLINTEKQQKAAFDAIAASAQSLADTIGMTEKEIQQSTVVADGELSQQFYDKEMERLKLKNFDDLKNLDSTTKHELENAIKEQYGSSAIIDNKGKVTYQKDGENAEITLTADQMKSMIAMQSASKGTTTAIEYSDEAISRIIESVSSQIKDEGAASDAINAMYMAKEGGSLTKKQLETLQLPDINIDKIWEELTTEERKAYGDDIENLRKDFEEAISGATDDFKEAGDATREFMTADMAAAWKKKLDEVDQLASVDDSKSNSKIIEDATDVLLGGTKQNGKVVYDNSFTEAQRQEIQSRIEVTDWTNLEQLKALQLDLIETYGVSAEVAKEYTTELAEVSYATSNLETTIQAFGGLYQANQKVAESLKKIEELQWKYAQALRETGESTKGIIQEQVQAQKELAENYASKYNETTQNLIKIGARAQDTLQFGGHDLSKYFTIREDGSLDTSKGKLGSVQDLYDIVNEDEKERISSWIEEYNTEWEGQQEALDGIRTVVDSINDLEEEAKDAYYELRDMAKDAILDSMQKQIDLQQETLDATKNANANLIAKIQEQIDDNRQARQNEEAKENIADLQSKQAYLSMDTSGANQLQTLELDKQISDAEQDYQDSLVDQTIQTLQDANAKAEEQRERQIALAEGQLEAYTNSAEFQQHTDQMLEEMIEADQNWKETDLGEMLSDKFADGMSLLEQIDWEESISKKIGAADDWKTTPWGEVTEGIKTSIDTLPEGIQEAIEMGTSNKAIKNQVSKLTSAGVDLAKLGITTDEKGNYVSTSGGAIGDSERRNLTQAEIFIGRDSDTNAITNLQNSINQKISKGKEFGVDTSAFQYLSQKDFYKNYKDGKVTLNGVSYSSYTDYLQKKASQALQGIDNLTAKEAFGAIAVPGSHSGINNDWKTGEWGDVTVDGTSNKHIKLGNKVSDSTSKVLDYVWNQTGGSDSKPFVFAQAGSSASDTPGWGLYLRQGAGNWWKVIAQNPKKDEHVKEMDALMNQGQNYLNSQSERKYTKYKFKTGGLADFTGPAWLDGTKSHPEYVLSAKQTERFFSLVDVLEGFDKQQNERKSSGDNYFDIQINVEEIKDDYDVEQLANKIRRMIYDDATYRNVNSINLIR